MSYTLKLDWTTYKMRAVMDVLGEYPELAAEFGLYLDDEHPEDTQTIKLDWPGVKRLTLTSVLETWLQVSDWMAVENGTSERELTAQQALVHAAVRDIYRYRKVTREAIEAHEQATGTRFDEATSRYLSRGR